MQLDEGLRPLHRCLWGGEIWAGAEEQPALTVRRDVVQPQRTTVDPVLAWQQYPVRLSRKPPPKRTAALTGLIDERERVDGDKALAPADLDAPPRRAPHRADERDVVTLNRAGSSSNRRDRFDRDVLVTNMTIKSN